MTLLLPLRRRTCRCTCRCISLVALVALVALPPVARRLLLLHSALAAVRRRHVHGARGVPQVQQRVRLAQLELAHELSQREAPAVALAAATCQTRAGRLQRQQRVQAAGREAGLAVAGGVKRAARDGGQAGEAAVEGDAAAAVLHAHREQRAHALLPQVVRHHRRAAPAAGVVLQHHHAADGVALLELVADAFLQQLHRGLRRELADAARELRDRVQSGVRSRNFDNRPRRVAVAI